MTLGKSLVRKLKGLAANASVKSSIDLYDPLDDFETRDQSVKSLRRLVRKQMDEDEKIHLQKVIRDNNRRRDRLSFSDNSIMREGGRLPKKKKVSVNGRNAGFLGRGGF